MFWINFIIFAFIVKNLFVRFYACCVCDKYKLSILLSVICMIWSVSGQRWTNTDVICSLSDLSQIKKITFCEKFKLQKPRSLCSLRSCQDHILTENIWLVWSWTSYSGLKSGALSQWTYARLSEQYGSVRRPVWSRLLSFGSFAECCFRSLVSI